MEFPGQVSVEINTLAEQSTELAHRNSEYSERMDQRAAIIDVLKAMSASPGDAQPVLDLIAVRARDVCDAYGLTVFEYDGTLIHYRAATGVSDDPRVREQVAGMYPRPPTRDTSAGRAILDHRIEQREALEQQTATAQVLQVINTSPGNLVPVRGRFRYLADL